MCRCPGHIVGLRSVRERDEGVRREREVRVNLVGQDEDVVLGTNGCNSVQLAR